MDASVKTEKYKGYTIKLFYDDDRESPREWDNLGVMVAFHGRYQLGDYKTHGWSDPKEFKEWLHENRKDVIGLPLYLYDHGGITMRTSSSEFQAADSYGWDWGIVGVIYVTKDDVRKEYSYKRVTKALRAKVLDVLRSEVEVYDQYLTGDVYGYVIEDQEGNHLDSLWGMYGDEYALEEARQAIDYMVEQPQFEI